MARSASIAADTNPEHERQVLAAIKHDNRVLDTIALLGDEFADPRHAALYRIMHAIREAGLEINDLAIVDRVRQQGLAIEPAYIAGIDPVTAANLDYYVRSVRDLARRRRLRQMGAHIEDWLRQGDTEAALDQADRYLTDLAADTERRTPAWNDLVHQAVQHLEEARARGGRLPGIACGYGALDTVLSGFQKEMLYVIGARPSVGKTALAVCLATEMALAGHSVGFFSAEMAAEQIVNRILAARGRLNLMHLICGQLADDRFAALIDAANAMYGQPLMIDDTPNISLATLRGVARHMSRRGAAIIFVDYLSLIAADERSRDLTMFERVGEIIKSLKALARELQRPVVVLSQLGRQAEEREPTLADLRLSGQIEEHADVVILMHRKRSEPETMLNIAKQRQGPVDRITLWFAQEHQRFYNRQDEIWQQEAHR